MKNLSEYVKRDVNGNVDVDATVSDLRTALEEYAALQKADTENIARAVNAVFDKNPNLKSINLPALASFACQEMGTNPAAYAETHERVCDYVRSAKSLYKIGKGRLGGVSRVTAEPAATPEG